MIFTRLAGALRVAGLWRHPMKASDALSLIYFVHNSWTLAAFVALLIYLYVTHKRGQ